MCAKKLRDVRIRERIDWKSFLARHDLVGERLPSEYEEGIFLGNGLLGTMIYEDSDRVVPRKENCLRFEISRTDVYDHRDDHLPGIFGRCRLPIGHFLLKSVGRIVGGTIRLDLWNAEATGTIITDCGQIEWRSLVPSEELTIIIEVRASEGEVGYDLVWCAERGNSPRWLLRPDNAPGYKMNPKPEQEKLGNADVCVQKLLAGGDYSTAWKEEQISSNHRVLYISIANGIAEGGSAKKAVAQLNYACKLGLDNMVANHRDWWHEFYPRSFVSIPDTILESFYWIQIYKLASATRSNRPMVDLLGPWYKDTAWPTIVWDLNVQLTYWLSYGSNHLDLGESLIKTLDKGFDNLIHNAPEEYREDSAFLGDANDRSLRDTGRSTPEGEHSVMFLPWACHNYWLHYRHCMDDVMLRDRFFPLLRRSCNLYLHLLKEEDDGRYHLPKMMSAEYACAEDTSQDIALLRWGLQTLLWICARLKIDDPLRARWREVLERLVDYHIDETGLMIGRDVSLTSSHRHYSHLLGIYPLYVINLEESKNRELAYKSLKHWIGLEGGLTGFSRTGAAAIATSLGEGDEAINYLYTLLKTRIGYTALHPNTMYSEWPIRNPVIETPLSAANCILEMLIQSWGDKIRIFPALPKAWSNVVFHNLRVQGAFLVSAVRKDGKTQFIRIKSLAGEPCRVKTDMEAPLRALAERNVTLKTLTDGVVELDIHKGETVILYSGDTPLDLTVSPVCSQKNRSNYFGPPPKKRNWEGLGQWERDRLDDRLSD